MNPEAIKRLLAQVAAGELDVDAAAESLRRLPFEELDGLARVDHHRELRAGSPEVVFGESKSADQIATILASLAAGGAGALATRVSADKAEVVLGRLGRGRYQPLGRTLVIDPEHPRPPGRGPVAVVAAGTSDLPVAEEAAETAAFLGQEVRRFTDVGVAGLQRVLSVTEAIRACEVAIIIAGMEGALPTVAASLVACPVIAVPTSVGYGVGFGGFAAVLGMLSSCAPGLTVVNIDNGFGAAVAAARMNRPQR